MQADALAALEEVAASYDMDVEDVIDGIAEGNLGLRRKRRGKGMGRKGRGRRGGRQRVIRAAPGFKTVEIRPGAVPTPDASAVSFPWSDVELLGLRPSGWTIEAYLQSVRNAVVATPAQALTARASFPATAANEVQTADFTTSNLYFLGREFRFDASDTAVSIVATIQQSGKFPLTGTQAVRLQALFGAAGGRPVRWVRMLAPDEPLVVVLTSEGAAPNNPHTVDFAYHGWVLGSAELVDA